MQTEGDCHRYNILQIFFVVHGWLLHFQLMKVRIGFTKAKFFYVLLYTTEFIHKKKVKSLMSKLITKYVSNLQSSSQ